ncbi:MAG: hypothetical protein IPJ81_04730 [Chitinophagaceae bacterium]|nr:hypothetical protein [Chitinophagaceae bacterium]
MLPGLFFTILVFTIKYRRNGNLCYFDCIYSNFSKQKSKYLFSAGGIVFKNILYTKKYSWSQVDYVVLKDGLLTINFISNKIIQVEVINDTSYGESIFNSFIISQTPGS